MSGGVAERWPWYSESQKNDHNDGESVGGRNLERLLPLGLTGQDGTDAVRPRDRVFPILA